jgi:cytochrome c oxidase subunit 2
VRAKPAVALTAAGLALLAAGAAAASNGGATPVDPASPNAGRIEDTFWVILAFTGFIFLLVETALVVFIVRYRRRGRSATQEGPQIRGHARLEFVWTVLPVLILALIGAFIFYKLPGIKNVPAASAAGKRLDVTVEGHRYYWEYRYPNGVVAVDTLRAPLGVPVSLKLVTPVNDVIHSWWIPSLGGKTDVIPGRTNHTWFQAERVGTFRGQCAEFCGIQHAAMLAAVQVLPRDRFESWLASEQKAQAKTAGRLGAETWAGACAKCHGQMAQGLVGPSLRGNSILADREGLETLIRNGRGEMPPVAQTWPEKQVDALFKYVKRTFAKAQPEGSGGS